MKILKNEVKGWQAFFSSAWAGLGVFYPLQKTCDQVDILDNFSNHQYFVHFHFEKSFFHTASIITLNGKLAINMKLRTLVKRL